MPFPELTAFCRHLQKTDPNDQWGHSHNRERLRELCAFVYSKNVPDLSACLDAALRLVDVLAGNSQRVDRALTLRLACETLQVVEGALAGGQPTSAQPIQQAQVAYAQPQPMQGMPMHVAPMPGAPAHVAPMPGTPMQAMPGMAMPTAPMQMPPMPGMPAQHAPTPVAPMPAAPAPADGTVDVPDFSPDDAQAATEASEAPAEQQPQPPAVAEGLPLDSGEWNPNLGGIRDMVLGDLLIELGYATREQIDEALVMHGEKRLPIGECLLLLGHVPPEKLLETLKIQQEIRSSSQVSQTHVEVARVVREQQEALARAYSVPSAGEVEAGQRVTNGIFIGEVLLGMGMIDRVQLEQAMHAHYHEGRRVGEVLLSMGALTQDDLDNALELHKRLRHVAGLQMQDTPSPEPDSGGILGALGIEGDVQFNADMLPADAEVVLAEEPQAPLPHKGPEEQEPSPESGESLLDL